MAQTSHKHIDPNLKCFKANILTQIHDQYLSLHYLTVFPTPRALSNLFCDYNVFCDNYFSLYSYGNALELHYTVNLEYCINIA